MEVTESESVQSAMEYPAYELPRPSSSRRLLDDPLPLLSFISGLFPLLGLIGENESTRHAQNY